MRINADFSSRVVVPVDAALYVNSPESGVERLMLDRIGDEVARATSIVRYAPGSSFPEHLHERGEEFLVLDGVFSDEHRHYPAGSYVRNPPGSRHSPFSEAGCRIFVKLRQFDEDDLTPVVVDANARPTWEAGDQPGIERLALHRFGRERVEMLRIAAATLLQLDPSAGGMECLLLDGDAELDTARHSAETWFRLPAGDRLRFEALSDCLVWQKTGHLPC